MSEIILLSNRDHSFSKYAKFFKKLIFLTPWYANARKWMILKWMIPYWLNGIYQLLAMIFSNIKSEEATMGCACNNLENSQKQKCWKNSWKYQGKILEEYHNLLNVAYFLQRSHCVKSIRENATRITPNMVTFYVEDVSLRCWKMTLSKKVVSILQGLNFSLDIYFKPKFHMWCFTWFATLCTISKTWKTTIEAIFQNM